MTNLLGILHSRRFDTDALRNIKQTIHGREIVEGHLERPGVRHGL